MKSLHMAFPSFPLAGTLLACVIVLAPFGVADAQVSGYISQTLTGHSNPLYNTFQISDRVLETYGELLYDRSSSHTAYALRYVGGLMMFDRFTERNSYEHNLQGMVTFASKTHQKTSDGDESGYEEEDRSPFEDSSGTFLTLGLGASARHDKEAFRDYDNTGAKAFGSYRFHAGKSTIGRVTVPLEYRSYTNLDALANLVIGASIGLRSVPESGYGYAVFGTCGYKYFTSSVIDTSLYETQGSSGGKGKGKGVGKGGGGASKKILLNETSRGAAQLSLGGSVIRIWRGGSAAVDAAYALNLGSATRYLAQNANTSMLTEDLYNDHFAYEGMFAAIRGDQKLPLDLRLSVSLEFARRRFGAPALDLDGLETAANRIDSRGFVSIAVSRQFPVGNGLAFEVSCGAQCCRNQSNDMYNDYSFALASCSVAFSF